MEWIYLLLVALVIAFGVGVLVVSRMRSRRSMEVEGRPGEAPTTGPPTRGGGAPTIDRPAPTAPPTDTPTAEPEVVEPELPEVEPEPAPATLRERLAKARAALSGAFLGIRGRSGIDEETWEDLEEALLKTDLGTAVADELLEGLRAKVDAKEIAEPDELLDALRAEMKARLAGADRALHFEEREPGNPNVWMFVGVNGVGKTTTIGKLANQQREDGRSVLLAAGDTFRAAAAEQLTTWAERAEAEIVRGAEGGDPSSVVFDAVERASARSIDLVFADTAGRLHTKTNLMEELSKVRRVAEKGAGRVTEVMLVLDATTGQNGMAQAREFSEATQVTGVALTKLDGSARGGIVFAIETELGIPVKVVGVGEQLGDLRPFDPDEFVDALFD